MLFNKAVGCFVYKKLRSTLFCYDSNLKSAEGCVSLTVRRGWANKLSIPSPYSPWTNLILNPKCNIQLVHEARQFPNKKQNMDFLQNMPTYSSDGGRNFSEFIFSVFLNCDGRDFLTGCPIFGRHTLQGGSVKEIKAKTGKKSAFPNASKAQFSLDHNLTCNKVACPIFVLTWCF